ncbi:MAG: hypothetical protein ACOC1D_00180 [Prolixibacteraceae bacterium]
MILYNKIYLFFIFFVLCWNTGNAQNLFNAANSEKFARYLLNTRQYELAANEFERILSINPADTTTFPNLMEAYRLGNICRTSFRNLEMLNVNRFFQNKDVAAEYLKLTLSCNYYRQEDYFTEALSVLDQPKQIFYHTGRFVFQEKTDSLILFMNQNGKLLSQEYPSIYATIAEIESYRRKKPALAAAMSAVIPGSGKAYTGYWGDAVMSLVFVSSNAWLSYKGFNKKGINSANGWIFGSISMGFYLGNIWGSGKAAKTYNRIEYEKLYHEAKGSFYNHF